MTTTGDDASWHPPRRKPSALSCTRRSGASPTICAAASTAGTSRPTCSACCSTASSRRTSPPTSTRASARPASPDFDYADAAATPRPSSAATRPSPRRASTSCRRELFVNVRGARRERREPQRDPGAGVQEHRGLRGRHRPARTTSRASSTTLTSTRPSSAPPSQAQREAGQAARRHRRPAPRRLRGQHDRRSSATPTST